MSALRKITPWAARPLSEAAKNAKHQQALELVATNVLLGRHAIIAGWSVGAVGALLAAVSMACWYMLLPLKTTEYVLQLIDRTTGVISKPVGLEDAPKLFPQSTDEHYLWQYLLACESWVPENDRQNDHICKIMSSPDRQARYQEWRDSPASPMNTLGRDGHIDIDHLYFYPRKKEQSTLNYLVVFNRTAWRGTSRLETQTWTADFAFQYHPELPMLPDDRKINAPGMVVISYDVHQGMAAEPKK